MTLTKLAVAVTLLIAAIAHWYRVISELDEEMANLNSTSERCDPDLLIFNRVPKGHKGRPHRGGRGVGLKADIVREAAWIYYYGSIQNLDKGEGVQKPENFADVLYVWPLYLVVL